MNKKFFQSALAVIAMMFGVNALAQTQTLNTGIAEIANSVLGTTPILATLVGDDGSPIPIEYPKVAEDGTVVMRDLFVYHQNDNNTIGLGGSYTVTNSSDALERGDRVILQLPRGVNFDGTPTAVAGAFTEWIYVDGANDNAAPLTGDREGGMDKGFVDSNERNDITLRLGSGGENLPLDNADFMGSVILEDTDDDGGMDKATVIVATGSEVTERYTPRTEMNDAGELIEIEDEYVRTRRNEAIRFRGSVTVSPAAASRILAPNRSSASLRALLTVRSAGSSDGDTDTIFRLSSEPNIIAEVQADAIVSPVDSQQNRAEPLPVFDNNTLSGVDSIGNRTPVTFMPGESTRHLLIVESGYDIRNNPIHVTLTQGLMLSSNTEIDVTPLTDGAPFLGATVDNDGRASLTFRNATPIISRETQYLITFSGGVIVDGLRGSGGSVTADYFGGVNGSAIFANLSRRGTSVTLAPRQSQTDLVIGAQQFVGLPRFRINSGFPGDSGTVSDTITVRAPPNFYLRDGNGAESGTNFGENNAFANASCGTGSPPTPLNTSITTIGGLDVLRITLTDDCATGRVITVAGLEARLTERASAGTHELTLEGTADNFTNDIAVVVAQGIEAGEVTLTNIADIDTVGPSSTGSVDIRITESTYGSVENGGTPDTFIRIEPSANVRITGVTNNTASRRNGFWLQPGEQARPPDGSWIVNVYSESFERLEVEDNARITINYTVMSDAAIGEDVIFTFSGDAGLSGEILAANVMRNSAVSVEGAVPSLTASVDAQATATFKIDAQYPGAINTMNTINGIDHDTFIRLIAPAGIIFTNSQPASNTRSQGLMLHDESPVSTTNSVSDTLRLQVTADDNLTYTPSIIVQESVAAGLAEFRIVDGLGIVTDDGVDNTRSGVTSEPIDLVHVGDGDMDELDAGADSITVAEGFSISQTVRGGLDTGEYEATSDSVEVALSEVSDGTLTITGVSVGSATITVSDELGNTDTIAVEVVAASAAPELMTLSSDGADTDATISGGVTVDNGVTYSEDGVVTAGDDISILFTINVDSEHVGEEGDIYVAVLDDDTDTFFIIDGNSEVIPDSGLAPFDSRTLTASETVEIRGGAFNFNPSDLATLSVTIFAGYTVDGLATIIFNGDGVPLSGE